jgi:hypothetical protein
MKKLLAALLLTAGLGMGQVSVGVGIRIGPPPAPRVLAVRPVAPGPDFFWEWTVTGIPSTVTIGGTRVIGADRLMRARIG